MKKFILATLFLVTSNTFADDIWFMSPQNGQNVEKNVQIQIQPPYQKVPVRVWIESDMGREEIIWSGQLTSANNYTLTVDTSKFRPGKYSIEAEYYIQGKDFDGDVTIWIEGNSQGKQQFYN